MRLAILLAAVLGATATASHRSTEVVQRNKTFSTASVTIAKGDSLVFRNDDGVVHNVFSADPGFRFNLRAQAPGASSGVKFDAPGSFHVRCAIHPTMKLDVTVTP
jgi:plastocyanin